MLLTVTELVMHLCSGGKTAADRRDDKLRRKMGTATATLLICIIMAHAATFFLLFFLHRTARLIHVCIINAGMSRGKDKSFGQCEMKRRSSILQAGEGKWRRRGGNEKQKTMREKRACCTHTRTCTRTHAHTHTKQKVNFWRIKKTQFDFSDALVLRGGGSNNS